MTDIWLGPVDEWRLAETLRDIATRLVFETDETEIRNLVQQLTRIIQAKPFS